MCIKLCTIAIQVIDLKSLSIICFYTLYSWFTFRKCIAMLTFSFSTARLLL